MSEWEDDKAWADRFLPEITKAVRAVAGEIVNIKPAQPDDDAFYATDYVVAVEAGDIACRIRRDGIKYRDWTIRNSRPSGSKTEREKIQDGFARWYLYGWEGPQNSFPEWIFVDLDKVRSCGLLNKDLRICYNTDGTTFVAVPIDELKESDCLVRHIR